MHQIEPYQNWHHKYRNETDSHSPFYNNKHNIHEYKNTIYGYYIHPLWDFIGSETLYIKILYINYNLQFAVIELFGEWNDTLHNDIMHLKRNIIDHLNHKGIKKYFLIGENIFNFHASDDCYYEEWFEDLDSIGWIYVHGFRYFVFDEWKKHGISNYFLYSDVEKFENWRTYQPEKLFQNLQNFVSKILPI